VEAEAPLEASQNHLQLKVNAFTSSKEELNRADIQRKSVAFTCRFSAQIDSKGRVTIPASIRDRIDLKKGDKIDLRLDSSRVIRKQFDSNAGALNFVRELQDVKEFSFDGELLEVVLSD